jgi:hypothetical protein
MATYPTEWKYGKMKVEGGTSDKGNTYLARYTDSNGETQSQYFMFSKYGSKENALLEANKWLECEIKKHHIPINQIRYIDKDTIEVRIINDITFKTDAIFFDIVQEHKIHIKEKKEKNGTIRQYVTCQTKKQAFTFASKICNYKSIKYKDGNHFNLKLSNLTEVGTIESDIVVPKQKSNINISNNIPADILTSIFNIDPFLPTDEWILGKPTGTIFHREGENHIWTVRVTDDNGKHHGKTFNVHDYKSDEIAKQHGTKWLYETSYKMNVTKNLIKILDDEYIEVILSKDVHMIIDKVFLPLIQKISLCAGKGGNDFAKYYAMVSVNNKTFPIHKLLMGNILTDHLNNNSLDNRLINLIWTNCSENNRNKITNDETTGTRLQKREVMGLYSYEARAKVKGQQFSKMFHFTEDEYKIAAERDVKIFRKNIFEIDTTTNQLEFTGSETECDLNFLIKRLKFIHENIMENAIHDPDEYIKNIDLNIRDRHRMHKKYIHIIFWRLINLEQKIDIAKKRLINLTNIPKKYTFQNSFCFKTNYSIKTYDELKHKNNENIDVICDQVSNTNNISKADVKEMKYIISLKNGALITNVNNIKNISDEIKILCKNEHEFCMTYDDFMNKYKWCNKCNFNSAGENKIKELCDKFFNEIFVKCRLDWLRNKKGIKLELDLYCEKLGLAFEYNGEQHYVFNPLYHSTEADFIKQQEHDKIKERLCKKQGVTLIIIPYTIKLDDIEKYILNKLKDHKIVTTKYIQINITSEEIDEEDTYEKVPKKINPLLQTSKTLDIISQKGGKLISGSYITRDSEVTIQCTDNHTWTTNFGKILSGSWCHTCGTVVSTDRKDKISDGVKKFNETEEGKALKKKSLEKRSDTMRKEREEIQNQITHKICSKCKDNKDVSKFGKKSDTKDGYQPYCRTCIAEAKKASKERKIDTLSK